MNKPIVFFSHTSADNLPLARLRDLILEKTGNSIQIFLSSDGQSIPFGRNWVHSVEEALNKAKLMFVFLSPAAIAKPGWINFESGYAYSKGTQVVPAGIMGVKIDQIISPLSLLQGFNISNASSASNIIAIINRTFQLSHPEIILQEQYEAIFSDSKDNNLSCLGKYNDVIDYLGLDSHQYLRDKLQNEFNQVADFLKDNNIPYQYVKNDTSHIITMHGIVIRYIHPSSSSPYLNIRIDPLISKYSLKLMDDIKELLPTIFPSNEIVLDIALMPNVESITGAHKITSRLFQTNIGFNDEEGHYSYNDWSFIIKQSYQNQRITTNTKPITIITMKSSKNVFSQIPIEELLQILFDAGVLSVDDN